MAATTDKETHKINIRQIVRRSSNVINKIAQMPDNRLYILTGNGLLSYTGSTGVKKVYGKEAFFDMTVNGRDIVAGASHGTLLLLSNNRLSVKKLPTHSSVTSLVSLPGNRIMAATDNDGIYILRADYTVNSHFTTGNSALNTNSPGLLNKDSRGDVWFCTGIPGVMRYDQHENRISHLAMPGEFDRDASMWRHKVNIAEDRRGNRWVSPSGNGLALFDAKTNTLIPFFDSNRQNKWTAENTVVDFFVDKQDNLWFCGKYTGLEKVTFNTHQFYTIDMPCATESGKDIRGMFQDRDGYFWVGAKNGIVKVFDKNMKYIGNLGLTGKIKPEGTENIGRAYCFVQDKTGAIWIGTKFNGLFRLQPKGKLSFDITHYKKTSSPYSLVHNDIFSLCIDSHDRLWIATYGGGICYLPLNGDMKEFISARNRLTTYPKETFAKPRFITTDRKGCVWVGTTSGLLAFSENFTKPEEITFRHYSRQPDDATSLSNNDVLEVFFTSSGEMYVCTYGGGFCHVERKGDSLKFRPFTTADGLRSDIIFSVQEDKSGNLWFATENGLVKYSPKSDNIETFSSRFFGKHIDINEGEAIRLHDGRLVFPSRNYGAMMFNPQQVKVSSYIPPIILTRFFLGQSEIKPAPDSNILKNSIDNTGKLTLPHDKNSFSIEFAALDYRDPDNISYAYMLEGLDKNWTTIGNAHSAIFNNIPPGEYTLKIRSTNSDGVWVENTRQINIEVTPSFWQTPWALMVYLLLAIGIITASTYILFTIFSLKQKVKIEQHISDIKLKFFTNISHEIRTPLTLISGSIKEMLRNDTHSPETKKALTVVDNNSNRLLRLVNQILDIRKMESGNMRLSLQYTDLCLFVETIMDNFRNIATEQKIDFVMNRPDKGVMVWADNEKLDKIVFNLLSNAFRFTPKGKSIIVTVDADDTTATLAVTDNGCGISQENQKTIFNLFCSSDENGALLQTGSGIGLTLTKELVELHHGTISVNSSVGKGSTFTVKLPMGKIMDSLEADYIMHEQKREGQGDDETTGGTAGHDKTQGTGKQGQSILVVEDNKEMRDFIKDILIRDYNIIEASNGAEGLQKAGIHTPDIIITDYMMPVMNGMDMAASIRKNIATSHIPIIILSALTQQENKICGFETGIDDYIDKPFSADILRARIKNLIAKQESMRQYFMAEYTGKPGSIPPTANHSDRQFMDRLNDILQKNISNGDLNVDDVASMLNMSRSVYFKKLKAMTGLSPNEFVKAMRMRRAAELIDTGLYSIAEISVKVGINDAHYLSKCFKQYFGKTPTEWKNRKTV